MRQHQTSPSRTLRMSATAIAFVAAMLASVLVVAATPASAAPATCFGQPVTIFAVPGVPTIGTPGDDVIMGTPGNDLIRGLGGNDRICGLGGANRIYGGPGDDRISGGPGDDVLIGGPGNDLIIGGPGNDILRGGPGDDVLRGGSGINILRGGPGNDTIVGQAGIDVMSGAAGGDRCSTDRGNKRTTRCSIERADVSEQVAQLETRMLRQINRLRRRVGAPPLQARGPMSDVARQWSARLPASFEHNPAVGSQIPAGWRLWAENIGYRVDPSARAGKTMNSVQRALVASPGHYANLVNPDLTHIGVGIHLRGGGVYVTQVFARY